MPTPQVISFSARWNAWKRAQRLAALSQNPANSQNLMKPAAPSPAPSPVALAAKTTPPAASPAVASPSMVSGLSITNVRAKVEAIAEQAGPPFLAYLKSEIARAATIGRDSFSELTFTLNGRAVTIFLCGLRPYGGGSSGYAVRTCAVTVAPEIAEHWLAKDWFAKVRQAVREDFWEQANANIRELGAEADFPKD